MNRNLWCSFALVQSTILILFIFVNNTNQITLPNDDLEDDENFNSNHFIEQLKIKIQNYGWKAGRNFDENVPLEHLKSLVGAFIESPVDAANINNNKLPSIRYENINDDEIPDEFDARKQWPECQTIKQIRDQGSCGSCWGVSAVEAMSDRICIGSQQKLTNVQISAQDLISCCEKCVLSHGCHGGLPDKAWKYWIDNGLVTGGPYQDKHTCKPYPFPECEHVYANGTRPKCTKSHPPPACKTQCQSGYEKTYDQDKYYGKSAYMIEPDMRQIQKEIMTNGPVQSTYLVYKNFFHYKSGVYEHPFNNDIIPVGMHSIKILGWGVENGKPYWLCANSWNTDWGEQGFFKILRGHNHCQIEKTIYAGLAKI